MERKEQIDRISAEINCLYHGLTYDQEIELENEIEEIKDFFCNSNVSTRAMEIFVLSANIDRLMTLEMIDKMKLGE